MRKYHLIWLSFLIIFLGGCVLAPFSPGSPAPASPVPAETPAVLPLSPSPSVPTQTPPAPTLTPKAPATQMPTPVLDPMSIEAMRAGNYPGSDIVLQQELDRGSNYRRYYAWYLSQGLKIYALLTIPDGDMPPGGWPAIVFNHGYIPPTVYRTTERYIAYVDRLARAGYIVFRIDYRGNDRSEGQATGAYNDPGYTVDVLNALASLERFPRANPNKIGMWGHSMGGFLTLRAMVISHDIKAGVIWSGVVGSYTDLLYNWHRSIPTPTSPPEARGGFRSKWISKYGTPAQNPDFWNSISANSYLADLSGPLQLHHGLADEEVPPLFSEELAAQVRVVGGTEEFYTYPGNDHNLSQSFGLVMQRTIEFYDRYLK